MGAPGGAAREAKETRERWETQHYLDVCAARLRDAVRAGEATWTYGGQFSVLRDGLAAARRVTPAAAVDAEVSTKLRRAMLEGAEYYNTRNAELSAGRDLLVGASGVALDAFFTAGATTGLLAVLRHHEATRDAAEQREYAAALQDLRDCLDRKRYRFAANTP